MPAKAGNRSRPAALLNLLMASSWQIYRRVRGGVRMNGFYALAWHVIFYLGTAVLPCLSRAIDRCRTAGADVFKEALMNLSWIHQRFKNEHSRSSGNVLNKPLDSGLRRNDGEATIKAIRLPV